MIEKPRSILVAYGSAAAGLLVALLFRWHFHPVLGERALYSTYLPAVLLAAYFGGFWPGLVFTIVCAGVANFFCVNPHYTLAIKGFDDAFAMALFVGTGVFISSLSESLHRAQQRILVAERLRAEEALRASEDRWLCLLEALPQLVWTTTPDGASDYFSTQWTKYTGLPESELRDWRWLDVLYPDDRERTRSAWVAAVADGSVYDVEHRIRGKDGAYRWFKTRGLPIRAGGREVFKWFGTCTDVTEAKYLEEALRHAKERLELAVRGSSQCIWEFDMPDGQLENSRQTFINLWELLGYDSHSSPTHFAASFAFAIHPEDQERVRGAIQACLTGANREFEAEYRVRHQDGTDRWHLARGVALRDAADRPVRILGSSVDITDRKRAEAELQHAKEAAEAANRAKDEFIANVSHEIRTPMGAVLGWTELALQTPLDEQQRQYLRSAKTAADSLLNIINDLLDFAKIEAGKFELDPSAFSLRATVADVLRVLRLTAEKKGLDLRSDLPAEVPDALVGDAGRLRQVLLNLVGNAVKFTERGSVLLRTTLADGPPTTLAFAITDTGIGIPLDKQATIFRAFEQQDMSITRKYGGTGLGLTIAARLAALFGGAISVASEPGRGSTFTFTARFAQQRDAAPPVPALDDEPAARALRILVAEDNEFNSQLLEHLLVRQGHAVEITRDGRAALARLGVAGAEFDVLLLDIHMPELDGFQVIGALRDGERATGGRRLPVIALTARSRAEDRQRCLDAGMDDFLTKPLRSADLFAALNRAIGAAAPRPSAPINASPAANHLDPAVLLAVCGDDAEGLRKLCANFQTYLPGRLAEAHAALERQDAAQLREVAHKLCGLLSALSTTAAEVASNLEDAAATAQLATCQALLQELDGIARALMQNVRGLSLETVHQLAAVHAGSVSIR